MNSQDYRNLQEAYLNVYENEQLDEVSDKLATAARNLRQKRYTKSADQARNLQLSKGNRADMFYKNFDKTVKLNDTLKSREKRTGTKIPRVEQLDLYDIILSHLIDEGYADTEQAAEAIMVNMSEEWRETIVIGEASVTDDRVRRNQKTFGSNYTPPRDWDQSANRGKGAVLNAKQKEKQRRKSLRQEEYMDEAQ